MMITPNEPDRLLRGKSITYLLTEDYVAFANEEKMSLSRRIRELYNEENTPTKLRWDLGELETIDPETYRQTRLSIFAYVKRCQRLRYLLIFIYDKMLKEGWGEE